MLISHYQIGDSVCLDGGSLGREQGRKDRERKRERERERERGMGMYVYKHKHIYIYLFIDGSIDGI